MRIHALNATGTGSTLLSWNCPTSGEPVGVELLTEGYQKGQNATVTYVIKTQGQSCLYGPGVYNLTALSCRYACTDQHGIVYAAAKTSFTISE